MFGLQPKLHAKLPSRPNQKGSFNLPKQRHQILWGLVITLIAAFAFEQSPFFVWVSSLPCTDAFLIWMPTPNSSGPPLHSTSLNKAWHSSLYSIGLGLPHKTHRYSNSKDHAPLEFSFYCTSFRRLGHIHIRSTIENMRHLSFRPGQLQTPLDIPGPHWSATW